MSSTTTIEEINRNEVCKMNYLMKAWSPSGLSDSERAAAWNSFLAPSRVALQASSTWGNYDAHVALIPTALDTSVAHEIEKDIERTGDVLSSASMNSLRRILSAYAIRNDTIGYCQGMNFITSLLLEYHVDEASTFWSLAVILEIILPSYHSRTMVGLHTDQRVLESLLNKKLPALALTLRQHHVDVVQYSTKWMVGLFINTLPIPTVLRIWDSLLSMVSEANEACRILFGTSLAILSYCQEDITNSTEPLDVANIFDSLQNFKTRRLSSNVASQAFLQYCFIMTDELFTTRDKSSSVTCMKDLRDEVRPDVAAQADAVLRLRGHLDTGYVVRLLPRTPVTRKITNSPLSKLRKNNKSSSSEGLFDPQEYEVTFDAINRTTLGSIGIALEEVGWFKKRMSVVVKDLGPEGTPGRDCRAICKGDVLLRINQSSVIGIEFSSIVRRLSLVTDKPFTLTFRKKSSSNTTSPSMFIRKKIKETEEHYEKLEMYEDDSLKKVDLIVKEEMTLKSSSNSVLLNQVRTLAINRIPLTPLKAKA